jgi:hypothetical protein
MAREWKGKKKKKKRVGVFKGREEFRSNLIHALVALGICDRAYGLCHFSHSPFPLPALIISSLQIKINAHMFYFFRLILFPD